MKPIAQLPAQVARELIGVFTDIDDTLTTEGAITPDALQALHDLRAAGLVVIPITGRPIGWCAPFLQDPVTAWPVPAMVAENGAVAYVSNEENSLRPLSSLRKQLSKLYQQDAATRALNYTRMQAAAQQVLREVPGARLSQDSAGRETDIAIDHSEFSHLSPAQIARVVQIMQGAGMTATVSSIHINGWFGAHNKLQGARWILRELLGRELDAEINRWLYVGDSTNDQLMFEHFPHSVGVANIQRFADQLTHCPRYITGAERGAGFAELTALIIAAATERSASNKKRL
jgi:HAD superfamily hydrolase (TIGR01484 family)